MITIWSGRMASNHAFTGRVPSYHTCQSGSNPSRMPRSNSIPMEGVCDMPIPPTILAMVTVVNLLEI